MARAGRRFAALCIDWALAWGIATLISQPLGDFTPIVIFAVLQILLIPTIGGGIGHRLLGMRVLPLGAGHIGFWKPIVRTVLLVLVVPALVWDSDQRGFHDKIAGTALIRS